MSTFLNCKNPAVIKSKKISNWKSCQTISANIEKCLELCFQFPLTSFEIQDESLHANLEFARKIKANKHDRLIFIDHTPHPIGLLQAISSVYEKDKLPDFIFYIYGDFTLYTDLWNQCEVILKRSHVQFITASSRQKSLIQSFVAQSKCVTSLPFPSDSNQFFYNPSGAETLRSKISLSGKPYVFLYTGRLSLQKNILRLIREFKVFQKTHPDTILLLAGPYDTIGAPFFNISDGVPSYQDRIEMLIENEPSIQYCGNLTADELQSYYSLANCFISLSTHHDEDFGMSVAEALLCGTQAILSNWGGYADFQKTEFTSLCPVEIKPWSISIQSQKIQSAMHEQLMLAATEFNRQKQSEVFQNILSTQAVAKILKTNPFPEALFQGFSESLYEHAALTMSSKNRKDLFPSGPQIDNTYWNTYKYYIRDQA